MTLRSFFKKLLLPEKQGEMNENLNKTVNIDTESPQIPAIVRDTEANSDNQENKEPASFLSYADHLKAESSDSNLSDSQHDDSLIVPVTESPLNATTTSLDSLITAFTNKLVLSSSLDESSNTQSSVGEVNLEEESYNEQNESVIDEDSVLTDDSQNNVTICGEDTEFPESQEEKTTCDYNLNESKPVVTEESIENSNNTLNNNQQITEKNSEILISDVEHIDPKTDVTLEETYIEPKNENSDINTTVITNTVEDISQEEIINIEVIPETIEEKTPPVSDEIIHPGNTGAEINENIPTAILIDISGDNINQSFEINNSFNQETEQDSINEQKSCLESFNSTDNSKTLTDISESLPTNIVTEEVHMSSSEPNSDVKEISNRLSSENNATSTNDMGEIIECFEKQLDVSNGAVDNKESLEAKELIYKEMTEKYATLEAESEKYKTQVCDLKKELKICRQKTVALEAEVADLNRRENELSILLEEKNKSPVETDSGTDQEEQVKRLQASEEALKNEVQELKGLMKQHENTLKDLQRKEVKLTDDLSCKTQSELQISRIMEEYEKSIATLISENEKMKKERDTAQMHLANIEMAFSDVHQKYERCKSIVQGYKDNEESFKQDIAMNRETIVIQEQKYETLKAHAMAQLEKSNQELAAMKKQHEGEIARLTAQLKRYEIKNMALTESLEQKAKECEQLAAVCDEYIGRV